MAIRFDIKTGLVFVRNFDQGVVETLGGYIGYYNASTGEKINYNSDGSICLPSGLAQCNARYYVDIPQVSPMSVPVIFNKPDPRYENTVLPSIVIQRLDPSPAMSRWHSIGMMQYRIPSEDATLEVVTLDNGDIVSGYSSYEMLPQAMPYDIPYTITVKAKYEKEAIPMLKKVLSVFKPCSRILVKDTECAIRSYTVWSDGGFSDVGELVDISNRVKAYSVEIRVEGELDLSDPAINQTVKEIQVNTQVF